MQLHILVVDDNKSAADALARLLRKRGDIVDTAYDGATAITKLQETPPDIILTDLKMEPVDGIQVLTAARAQRPPIDVIVFTAYGAVDVAVRAMRLGARDFLTKPVTVDQLSLRLEKLRSGETMEEETGLPFVAVSNAGRALLEVLERCAGVQAPVWIEGELGSGRAYAALTIHQNGSSEESFTVRNLGREEPWPESGTVLLPDVDALPDDLQQVLARSLLNVPEKVRIIATSAPNSRRMVEEGKLRADLYFALAVVIVSVPPLRDRKDDIQPLLAQALRILSERYQRPAPTPLPSQLSSLKQHAWPGNVRELRNLAERAVVIGANAFNIPVSQVTQSNSGPVLEPGFSLSKYLEGVEREILKQALRIADGDRTQAGRILGVERNTLRYKLNKYGLLDK